MDLTIDKLAVFFSVRWAVSQKKVKEYLNLLQRMGAITVKREAGRGVIMATEYGRKLLAEGEEETEPISMPSFELEES